MNRSRDQPLEVAQAVLAARHEQPALEPARAQAPLRRLAQLGVLALHLVDEGDELVRLGLGDLVREEVLEERERPVGRQRHEQVDRHVAGPGRR